MNVAQMNHKPLIVELARTIHLTFSVFSVFFSFPCKERVTHKLGNDFQEGLSKFSTK